MIAIVDVGMGNLRSIATMLQAVGAAAEITGDTARITAADRIILPGVGAFDHGMTALRNRGLLPVLERRVREDRIPVLGICLGMQLLTRGSEEGVLPGLGWLAGDTRRLAPADLKLKVPHMGWNAVQALRPHPLFAGLEEARFYFAHSYAVACDDPAIVLAVTDHGAAVTAAVADGNIMGVQFHPEKSHRFGLRLLRKFAEMTTC